MATIFIFLASQFDKEKKKKKNEEVTSLYVSLSSSQTN